MKKTKNIKKPVSLVLTFAIIISAVWLTPITASASLNPERMSFEDYIVASYENITEQIDISYYIRNNSEWLQWGQIDGGERLADWLIGEHIPSILSDNPQLFHVSEPLRARWYENFSVFTITPNYTMSRSQYADALRKFNTAATQALRTIRHAETDFEKALLLHNYIILNTEYDENLLDYYVRHGFNANSIRPLSHTAYGALVDGLAVCDGYAKAYMHLLRMAGIESRVIFGQGRGQFHAWNLMRVGGNWYHTDPTWNDPIGAMFGTVMYDNFLLTGSEIGATHTNWQLPDGITTDSNLFRNAFFRTASSAVVKLGDYFYWLEYSYSDPIERGVDNNFIKRHNTITGHTDIVYSFESFWYVDGTEYSDRISAWAFSNAGLAAYDGLLYFNTAKEIFSFDPETNVAQVVHQHANLGGTGNRFIFGMMMYDNIISFSVKTTPQAQDEIFKTQVPFAAAVAIGTFTSADALTILRYNAGLANLTVEQRLSYDLNNDGVINTADAIIILRRVAGIA